jgi:hypothetical protein
MPNPIPMRWRLTTPLIHTGGEDFDYDVGDVRNSMTSRSGSADVTILPINGCERSTIRKRWAATRTPTVATIA